MLASAAYERPLIEDWIIRRQRLSGLETTTEQHRLVQLRILDYLIHRYADSPEAALPARFASTAAFFCNDRLIVVHNHLGRGKIAGVKNRGHTTGRRHSQTPAACSRG